MQGEGGGGVEGVTDLSLQLDHGFGRLQPIKDEVKSCMAEAISWPAARAFSVMQDVTRTSCAAASISSARATAENRV